MSARSRHRPWFRTQTLPPLPDSAVPREYAEYGPWVTFDAPELPDVQEYEYVNTLSPERWAEIEKELEEVYRKMPDPVAIFGTLTDWSKVTEPKR